MPPPGPGPLPGPIPPFVDFRESRRGRWRWYLMRLDGSAAVCQSATSFATRHEAAHNYLACAGLIVAGWRGRWESGAE